MSQHITLAIIIIDNNEFDQIVSSLATIVPIVVVVQVFQMFSDWVPTEVPKIQTINCFETCSELFSN